MSYGGDSHKYKNVNSIEHLAELEGYATMFLTTECGYYYASYASKPPENRHKYEDMEKCHHDNLGLACD